MSIFIESDLMREIPQDKKNLFDEAVSSFTDENDITVTSAKLEAFLSETQGIDVPADERLRQLAIALESEILEKGWEGLRVVYQAASQANPHYSYVFQSWGISASEWFEDWKTPEMADRLAIALEAEKVLTIALDLKPQDSNTAYTLGRIFLNHPARSEDPTSYLSKAIFWFCQAIEWDINNAMAQLHLAHCYHDLAYLGVDQKYWGQAVEAYEKVNQDLLTRDWPAWRALKCREQLAACYAWAGNEGEAVRRFSSFLDEIETFELDEYGGHESVMNFHELVDALTRKLHNSELLQRTRIQVKRYRFEYLYKELFSDNI